MANEYLRRIPTSSGNRRVFTWSGWVKLNNNPGTTLFSASPTKDNNTLLRVLSGGQVEVFDRQGSDPTTEQVRFNQILRDYGSWTHILINADTTQETASSRVRAFINGVELSRDAAFTLLNNSAATNTPPKNQEFWRLSGAGYEHYIGAFLDNTLGANDKTQYSDVFFIDGQALTPDVFGKYIKGNGYISAGSTQSTDFRKGQWVPKAPRVIKSVINVRGGFGVNGFYLPMNDSNNFGADFHCDPNSIIKLNEELAQPKVGVSTATVGLGYTDVLRADPYAANLVLALPFVSSGLCTNGTNVGVNTGFGDYSAVIKGSGSAKTLTNTTAVSIATTAGYYGSAANFGGSHYLTASYNSDFNFGTENFTVEMWVYPTAVSDIRGLFAVSGGGGGVPKMVFHLNSGTPSVHYNGLTNASDIYTAASSAIPTNQWTHLAYVRKGTTWTWFTNGVATGIGTNTTVITFTTQPYYVGYGGEGYFAAFNGYLQDFRVYKGVAKYTGGFDVPRPYTPVGIATWRAVPDTPANNFATWNPVSPASDTTFTNGNLTVAYGSNSTRGVVTGTVGIAVTGAGKYYWENRIDASSASPTNAVIGVWGMSTSTSAANYAGFTNTYGWSYYGNSSGSDGFYWATGGAVSNRSYGATYTTGDIIGVTLDMTTNNGSLEFYKNGVSQGVATTGIGTFLTNGNIHAIMPAIGDGAGTATYTISSNFGQNPTFSGNTTAGTFTDSNGKGLFKYQPPSGFLALCEDNLPTPAISDPGKYFKTVLWTGSGSARSIVGVGFTPDLVWIKARNLGGSTAYSHNLYDSVRPTGFLLASNETSAEVYYSGYGLSAMNSDGFSIVGGGSLTNDTTGNYVAWCWRAGAGTTSTNTNGSVTSMVSVNQDAGFSIVSYTGTGANATVGHGLGKAPKFIIIKNRIDSGASGATNGTWKCYHNSLASNFHLTLNSTDAQTQDDSVSVTAWNNTRPTSNVFSVGNFNSTNGSSDGMIAYCWAEIDGFSKFGSFSGNSSTDGVFVYTGFRPAWVMIKRTDSTDSWAIFDSSRDSTNPVERLLRAESSNAEATMTSLVSNPFGDLLSNGFKIRNTSTIDNTSGGTYIFAAFAESPFKTANAK